MSGRRQQNFRRFLVESKKITKILRVSSIFRSCYQILGNLRISRCGTLYIWASFGNSRKGFRKLQEAIWLTVINEIFKFPPELDPFCQIDYFYELSSGYPNYPIQKWCIWAEFQASRKRFHKLQEIICSGVARNSGLGGPGSNRDLFCIVSKKAV